MMIITETLILLLPFHLIGILLGIILTEGKLSLKRFNYLLLCGVLVFMYCVYFGTIEMIKAIREKL